MERDKGLWNQTTQKEHVLLVGSYVMENGVTLTFERPLIREPNWRFSESFCVCDGCLCITSAWVAPWLRICDGWLNGHGVCMTAPNYDEGSCYIYEGWRFGSVRRKPRRLGRKIEPDRREVLLGRRREARIFGCLM